MPRIRSGALALGQSGFSLGKQSDMVFPQFHEYPVHVWAVEPLQSSCAENLRVKLLGPVRIHHGHDKVIQVPDIPFRFRFSAHVQILLFLYYYLTQELRKQVFQIPPFFYPRPADGEREG